MSALLYLGGASSGFVLPTQPGLCRPGRPGTAAAAVSTPTVLHPQAVPTRAAAAPAQMGLFGLGYPELAVIGLVGIVLLGPERLVPMAKDLGSALQPSNTPSSLGLTVVDLAFRPAGVARLKPSPPVVLTPTLILTAGKGASGLKEVTDSFAQGMAEGEVG